MLWLLGMYLRELTCNITFIKFSQAAGRSHRRHLTASGGGVSSGGAFPVVA
jgi:hypothetical protein